MKDTARQCAMRLAYKWMDEFEQVHVGVQGDRIKPAEYVLGNIRGRIMGIELLAISMGWDALADKLTDWREGSYGEQLVLNVGQD